MGDIVQLWPRPVGDDWRDHRPPVDIAAQWRVFGSPAWQVTRDAFGRAVADRLFPEGRPEDAA